MARGTPRPSPSITSIADAIQGGAIGYIQSQLGNPFIPMGGALQNIYSALPLLGSDDIGALIEMAREQSAAGAAFGTPDVYRRPTLAEIPICPGCPANKIETTIRVQIFDPTLLDRSGNPVQITHGIVHCVDTRIPTLADLQECVDSWSENIVENFYPAAGGFQATWEVISAQRGTFFGR